MHYADTHCHLHDPGFFDEVAAETAYQEAKMAGVDTMLLVGTSLEDSKNACSFAGAHKGCFASLGIHPHEASQLDERAITTHLAELAGLADNPVVKAVGECGFDFYYNERKEVLHRQQLLLEGQLELAGNRGLPVSFHVREGFSDFWPVFDRFPGITGVLHSFTDRKEHLEKALERGLYIGINGIATFTTHQWQLELLKEIPLEKIVIETDAPFLTPVPRRGTINVPKNVIYITQFLAELRGEDVKYITTTTTKNARNLFGLC